MNTPNHPPPDRYGGPPPGGPYGRPGPYGPPPGGQRPHGPPGGLPPGRYGPPGGRPGGPAPGPGYGPGPGPGGPGGYGPPPQTPPGGRPYGAPPGYGGPPPPPPPPPPSRSGGYGDLDERDESQDLPPAPPPGTPSGTPPPTAKPGNNKLAKVIVLVVVLGIVIGVALWLQSSAPSSAEVGDCIKINDVTEADIEKVDCNSAEALYKVAVTKDDDAAGCPAPAYLAYTESGRNELLLCLSLNAKAGDCFQVAENTYKKVACTAPEANFRVSEVFNGKDDPAQCGDAADQALSYPEPPMTICRVAPDTAAT